MKKSFLLKEYEKLSQPGVKNMKAFKNYFGSQLIDVEDIIRIDDSQYKWTQNLDGSQFILLENPKIPAVKVNLWQVKRDYHNIKIQSNSNTNNPVWSITVQIKSILMEYIRARIKTERTFEGISAADTAYKNLDLAIYQFIDSNILSRYKLKQFLLFVEYIAIGGDFLPKKPIWDYQITYNGEKRKTDSELKRIIINNIELIRGLNQLDEIKVNFKQINSAQEFIFKYHYDLIFEKI